MRSALVFLPVVMLLASEPPPLVLVSAENAGGFGDVDWWAVELESGGRLRLLVQGSAWKTSAVSEDVVGQMRAMIIEERLVDLPKKLGEGCHDCSICVLRVQLGDMEKSITIATYPERVSSEDVRLEMARALRVWDKLKEIAGISELDDACHAPDS